MERICRENDAIRIYPCNCCPLKELPELLCISLCHLLAKVYHGFFYTVESRRSWGVRHPSLGPRRPAVGIVPEPHPNLRYLPKTEAERAASRVYHKNFSVLEARTCNYLSFSWSKWPMWHGRKNLSVLLPEFVSLSAQATGQIELMVQLAGLRGFVGNPSAKEELVVETRLKASIYTRER